MVDEPYGIDKHNAHPRAIELIPEPFFWDCVDELAPFGSDEGDTALAEYRDWRKEHPKTPTLECLRWTIESVGEMDFSDYNKTLLNPETIHTQLEDPNFDDQQFIYTLDISIIATGFGQLVDEGKIDAENKPIIQLALNRQKIWAAAADWEYKDEYIHNLSVIESALAEA